MLGAEPGLVMCKANTLFVALSLQVLFLFCFVLLINNSLEVGDRDTVLELRG